MLILCVCFVGPMFEQKGCEQSLTRNSCVVGVSQIASTIDDCGKQCGMKSWCAGFNYNLVNGTCEQLTENSTTEVIVCDPDWFYYERV